MHRAVYYNALQVEWGLLLDTELSMLISFASFRDIFILKELNQVNHIKHNPTGADRICQQQLSFPLRKTMISG